MKKLLCLVIVLLVGFVLYALVWPSPFRPVAWNPPPAGLDLAPPANRVALTKAQRLAQGVGHGPEDVAVDARGRLYAGYADGTIHRFDADAHNEEVFATTNGRPLGLAFARSASLSKPDAGGEAAAAEPAQTLIVADADRGVLAIDSEGSIRLLSKSADDTPFAFTDDVDVAANGRIYFTDASSKYDQNAYRSDILEHGGHGRLLQYNPASGRTRTLVSGLQFANGVALGPDDAYVLVTETGSYRVIRYWLTGDKTGQSDVFIANLPGFPDGISFDGNDTFWLALFAPRSSILDRLAPYPWLRRIVFHLPGALQPQPARVGHVLGVDTQGRITHNLKDTRSAAFAPITSVQQADGMLYLGSLQAEAFARLPLSSAAMQP